ncbi:hypothetical protein QYZ88_016325 [Lachnospiraceae bacterium C1.1]|nr:hypothetical protein [Lachnospiraceae bacterium C1.1]
MKDIFVNKYDHYEILIFISGLFSTFQALTFHGITVFSWFLLLMVFLGIAEKRGTPKINLRGTKEILIGLVLISMTITELITVCLNLYPAWTSRSINNYILMSSVLVLYFILRGNERYRKLYMKGIMISCIIQYIACYVEYLLFTIFDFDLTSKILHVETRLRDSYPTITGLTTNQGMVVPVILIGLCLSSKLYIRIMALIAAIIINSSTCVLCIAFFFGILFLKSMQDKASNGWNFTKIVLFLVAFAFIAFIFYEPLREKTYSLSSYLIKRLSNASTATENNDGSTFFHFRYYWSIPYLFDHISTLQKIFGFGKNCSGIPFIEYYSQYTDKLWIPESDPISMLYDVGIFGFTAFYTLLGKITIDLYRKKTLHGIFMLCALFGGIFYGFQMTWFLLMELLLWEESSSSISISANSF